METIEDNDDSRIEAAVLYRVLDLHPARLTPAELARDMGCKEAALGGDRQAVQAAIDSLASVGLLHRPGDGFVTATRAAVHLAELFPLAP
jgi:hypothetical protein